MVAPADGRISLVTNAAPPRELGLGERPLPRVSIFMSVFDCHVNRSPAAGRIERMVYAPASSSTPISTRRARTTSATRSSSRRRRARRRGADRRPDRAAHRLFRARGRGHQRRRAHRHDPVRLPGRRLPAGGGEAAGGGGPDGARRRDRHRRPARAATRRAVSGSADVKDAITCIGGCGPRRCYIHKMLFPPFDPERLEPAGGAFAPFRCACCCPIWSPCCRCARA